jgi:hypothetical protein
MEQSHGLLDPNIRWEELGCQPRRFGEPFQSISSPASRTEQARSVGRLKYGRAPLPIIIQNYSSAGKTFDRKMVMSWTKCAGLAVPPLKDLGKSFLRAFFGLRRSGATSRTEGIISVWIASLKGYGYTPLGVTAMKGVPGVDKEMQVYWERGY